MGIPRLLIAVCALPLCLAACSGRPSADQSVLNVYQWSDYVAPGVIEDIEREYAIKVNYDVFDSNEVLETKMLMGHSNTSTWWSPPGPFLQRQITRRVYQKLDKAQLPNLRYVDPEVARESAVYNPGNAYGVDYMWITSGPGYNVAKIRERMPDAPVDSLRMIFDPSVVSRFQDCGVAMLDTPPRRCWARCCCIWVAIRTARIAGGSGGPVKRRCWPIPVPTSAYVHSSRYIDDLANGEICLAMGWSGDVKQAYMTGRRRPRNAALNSRTASPRRVRCCNLRDMVAIPADVRRM